MRKQVSAFAFSSLLFRCRVLAQTSIATWQFPLEDGLTINYIDTVVLQWTSNYNTAWMNMWCQNGTIGNNVVLGSQFMVQPSGSFPYIMFTEDPTQAAFPVACHAQLLADAPNGSVGMDDPVGVTFTSNTKVEAKTFSSSASSTSTSSLSTVSSSLSSFSSSSTTSLSTSFSTSRTSSDDSLPSPTNGANSGISNNGLTGGANAGIGIGATVGALAILGSIAYIFWRRRKAIRRPLAAELDNKEAPGAARFGRYELEDEERRTHELPATTASHALEQDEPRYELPAGKW